MTEELKIGDKVEVMDAGLEMLRQLMGPKARPNHHGTVAELWDDGTILVEFPIPGHSGAKAHSQVAPYPSDQVKRR